VAAAAALARQQREWRVAQTGDSGVISGTVDGSAQRGHWRRGGSDKHARTDVSGAVVERISNGQGVGATGIYAKLRQTIAESHLQRCVAALAGIEETRYRLIPQ
jgi:hypothetical protein